MFIEIPVYYYPDDYDPESAENLGMKTKVEVTLGSMVINVGHVCSYNENDNGNTMVSLSNGAVMECPTKFKEFKKIISELECTSELIISNEN